MGTAQQAISILNEKLRFPSALLSNLFAANGLVPWGLPVESLSPEGDAPRRSGSHPTSTLPRTTPTPPPRPGSSAADELPPRPARRLIQDIPPNAASAGDPGEPLLSGPPPGWLSGPSSTEA